MRSCSFGQIPRSFFRHVSISIRYKRPDLIESAVKGEGVQMRRNVVGKLFGRAQ
jgi:hypothetical protein